MSAMVVLGRGAGVRGTNVRSRTGRIALIVSLKSECQAEGLRSRDSSTVSGQLPALCIRIHETAATSSSLVVRVGRRENRTRTSIHIHRDVI